MAQTAQEYHENESNWGGYAFVDLKTVINKVLIRSVDADSHLVNVRRSVLVDNAKDGIRILNREVKKTILAAEITVGPRLYLPLPQDFIDWVRVSVVDDSFKLRPLKQNSSMQTATGYLQDHNYDILFDSDGEILTADSSNVFNKPYKKYVFCPESGQNNSGHFVIDEKRGVIAFSSDLEDREIVIEYISDGLQMRNLKETEIKIHKNILDVLMAFIYKETISFRKNVPANEKYRAEQKYKGLLHTAKMDNLHFNISEISKTPEFDQATYKGGDNITIVNQGTEYGWGSFKL